MRSGSTKNQRYRVGDRVRFEFGGHTVRATIIEDRGFIGAGGRRLLRVRLMPAAGVAEGREFEVPEDEVKPAA